ncbi:MAG: redox-regulated ATPase YchF [Planctomycetota bacterium]
MSVSCGIVGLPNVGKSTIFSALSSAKAEVGNFPFCTIEPNVAIVEVPDTRLEVIHGFVKTQKVIPAVVKVVDIAGLVAGASEGEGMGNKFLGNIKECDAIMQVVRCFGGEKVLREDPVDPIGDIEIIELELNLADLETVRRNADRVAKKARAGDKDSQFEKETFDQAVAILDEGQPLRSHPWNERQRQVLKPLFLMSMKPVLYVANVADDDLAGESEWCQKVAAYAAANGSDWLPICGDLELELRSMEEEDRAMFMEELGVEQLGLERLIQTIYHLLGLQTYFTAGEKEVRAWTIHRGDTAPRAAGVIHTDFEKAFIRAEVYSVTDLEDHQSESAIRAAGRLRTEGRDYAMQDGDIAHFLVGK